MTTTPGQPDLWPVDDFVTTEELVRRQGARPIASVNDLAAAVDPFESDAEYEEFLVDLYASRRVASRRRQVSLVVIDTDVASTLLRRRVSESLAGALAGNVLAVTFVTVGELTKWTLVRRWGPRNVATMRTFLAGLVVLLYERRVAARWGELQAYAQLRGRPRPTNDSWIASCCLVRELPLATLNVKDFADFEQHEGLELVR